MNRVSRKLILHRFCKNKDLFSLKSKDDSSFISVASFTSTENESKCDKEEEIRRNAMNIQMLFSSLHKQIFKTSSLDLESASDFKVQESIDSLKKYGLWGKESQPLSLIDFKLPNLLGNNLDEHFRIIAEAQCSKYMKLGDNLANCQLPTIPKLWAFQTGWVKYSNDGSWEAVDFPNEDAFVFDVEVLVTESPLPIMASAVSSSNWYSWCSRRLVENRWAPSQMPSLADFIPLETKAGQGKPLKNWTEKLVIGHNVSYDRARIKEQYFVKGTKTRFVDTMSLHIATSGLSGLQRALLIAEMTGSKRKDAVEAKAKARGPPIKYWMNVGSLNNLSDVHKLHCGGSGLKKELVETFIKGQISDVQKDFQNLMTYCANDVKATFEVFQVVWPLFFQRCPHPVTFAGMLEMSVAYLPVNDNWKKYIDNAQTKFDDLERELKLKLARLANDACELLHNNEYKDDVWLWDLDWNIKEIKIKKSSPVKRKKTKKSENHEPINEDLKVANDNTSLTSCLESGLIETALQSFGHLYAKRPHLPGYPTWFCDLCPKYSDDEDWIPGPTLISSQMRIVPKLLRLTWSGYPLHYSDKNGWGYLVPGRSFDTNLSDNANTFPFRQLEGIKCESSNSPDCLDLDEIWAKILDGSADVSENSDIWNLFTNERKQKRSKKVSGRAEPDLKSVAHHGNGPYLDEDIPGCWFYRLPHKDGPNNKVGNPLAKDFINKIEDGTLRPCAGENADWALKLSKMISYWKNAHKRIASQMVVWLKKGELPKSVTDDLKFESDNSYGAILPAIVTSGTVTRRAVEATWMTASNAYVDRVGSELKSMIQAFPGYRFVGADVDSQELWIAAILGDAHNAGLHGCTPFGWMTLQGKKSQETDMHSVTAKTAKITRDQAKVLNYGRIYGAGEAFATRLLMQFNHQLTLDEAKNVAHKMYTTTKGVRGYLLNDIGKSLYLSSNLRRSADSASRDSIILSRKDLNFLLRESQSLAMSDVTAGSVWMNGTESAMFNKLEKIALSPEPKTPVLECQISRALEPANVMDNFITSRINWVVQSSAVDYLHLLLVSMKWLFDQYDIDGRFSISIHDEVRYLVKSEDCYRAALALQITNLLTRAMFGYKLGMNDLPQSVAFFSSVDIDTVLRKEVHLDCKTPSNHLGLQVGYGILPGESLDIHAILKITNGFLKKRDTNKPALVNKV